MKNRETIKEVRAWIALAVAVISMTVALSRCTNESQMRPMINNISITYNVQQQKEKKPVGSISKRQGKEETKERHKH